MAYWNAYHVLEWYSSVVSLSLTVNPQIAAVGTRAQLEVKKRVLSFTVMVSQKKSLLQNEEPRR